MLKQKIQRDEIKIEVMEKYHLIVKERLAEGREGVDKNWIRKWNNNKTKRTCLHTNPVQFVAIVIWISNNRLCCSVVLLQHTILLLSWQRHFHDFRYFDVLLTDMHNVFRVDFVYFLVFHSSTTLISLGIFYTRSTVFFNVQ